MFSEFKNLNELKVIKLNFESKQLNKIRVKTTF